MRCLLSCPLRARAVVVGVLLFWAGRAGAPPPLSPFPDRLLPDEASTAPRNTRLWIFGENAPPAAQVGVAVTAAGQPVDVVVTALGTSGFVVELAPFAGNALEVFVSSAAGDVDAAIGIGGVADDVDPALLVAAVIDDRAGLVLGLEGSDDRGLAGFLARRGGVVVGATAFDRLLRVDGPCVDVSAVDLAGNESPATTLCAGEGEGEGEAGEGEGEGEGEGDDDVDGGCGCASGPDRAVLALGFLGMLPVLRRGRRRSSMNPVASVLLVAGVVVVGVVGCPGADGGADGGEGEGEAAEGEGEVLAGDVVDNDYGFDMHTTVSHALPCEVDPFSCPDGSIAVSEVAYVCTLTGGVGGDGVDGVVYVHALPTSLNTGGFPFANYDDVRAFLSRDGVITSVEATYDFGGNHHNDLFTVDVNGARYTFNHSSIGFGFRVCQPPDCLLVERDGAAVVDGCNPERTLPEACIEVANPLPPLVDNFAVCAGDPG